MASVGVRLTDQLGAEFIFIAMAFDVGGRSPHYFA
jgi:hypothetical protein